MAHHNRGFLRILMALVMITTMFGGMYIPQAAPAGAQEAAATPVTLAEDEPDPPAPGGSVTVTVADSVTGSPVSTASVDDELSVTVEIHNTGNVSISNLSIASLVFASGPAPVFGLEPTQTTSKAYIYTVTAADLAAGSKAFEFWVSSNEISPPMYGTATISVIEPEPPAENTPTQPAATSEPPIATHEDLTIVPGTTVTIDVVANDFDPDTVHADLTISLDPSQPPHWGSVELDPENPHQIIYTAPPGVLGDDWFAYLLSDGVNTVQGVVIFRYRGEQSLRVEMTDPTGYAPARLCVQLTFYYPDGSGSMTFYPFCGDPADPWNVTIDGLV
ncbi:MAG: hypothetical protein IT334_11350, partial [Thermomicrobiales bacterium]|nr:hypothetical protein [Thermomicrobiales bacterium]